MASINARDYQKAHLVDEIGLEERPIDVAASFKQQGANPKVLAKLVYGCSEVNRRVSRNDLGNSFVPEHGQVVVWNSLAHGTDEVITAQVAARPQQLASISTETA